METNITYFVDDTNNYKVPGQFEITTAGGSAAVQAAIDYIAAITTPLSPYTFEDGLESACKDHVDDLETTEIEGNTG